MLMHYGVALGFCNPNTCGIVSCIPPSEIPLGGELVCVEGLNPEVIGSTQQKGNVFILAYDYDVDQIDVKFYTLVSNQCCQNLSHFLQQQTLLLAIIVNGIIAVVHIMLILALLFIHF